MVMVNKVDYIKVNTLENKDINFLSDYDRFTAGVEYNEKSFSFFYSNVKDISGLDITKDLFIKVKAFYKTLNKDNKQNIYNEILLTMAELIFKLRIDLGVKS
jgi:hypothetical protein